MTFEQREVSRREKSHMDWAKALWDRPERNELVEGRVGSRQVPDHTGPCVLWGGCYASLMSVEYCQRLEAE